MKRQGTWFERASSIMFGYSTRWIKRVLNLWYYFSKGRKMLAATAYLTKLSSAVTPLTFENWTTSRWKSGFEVFAVFVRRL